MRWLLVLLAVLLVGCGQERHATLAPASGKGRSGVAARLGRIAYAQARAAGNANPQSAAYVASHRRVAVRVSEGGDRVDSNQPVWLVEVVGPFTHSRRPSVPPGVKPWLRCRAITFTVERATWQTLDSGCGQAFDLARLGNPKVLASPSREAGPPPSKVAACVSASAPSVRVGPGKARVRVSAGAVVTVWLTEPEAYASGPDDTAPPATFPWLAAESSDPSRLTPLAVCKQPPLITSLPARLYPFRALRPGRYQIGARLDPAYHIPRFRPPLRPLQPVSVTVMVTTPPPPRTRSGRLRFPASRMSRGP